MQPADRRNCDTVVAPCAHSLSSHPRSCSPRRLRPISREPLRQPPAAPARPRPRPLRRGRHRRHIRSAAASHRPERAGRALQAAPRLLPRQGSSHAQPRTRTSRSKCGCHLTAANWNHRFQGQGNGGFAGEIDYEGSRPLSRQRLRHRRHRHRPLRRWHRRALGSASSGKDHRLRLARHSPDDRAGQSGPRRLLRRACRSTAISPVAPTAAAKP